MTLAEQIDKLGATALEIKAQRDRYEAVLRDIATSYYTTEECREYCQEALRCE